MSKDIRTASRGVAANIALNIPGLLAGLLFSATTAEASTPTAVCIPTVIASTIVDTASQRQAAGAMVAPQSLIDPNNGFAWPDTPMGVVPSKDGKSLLFFASDGGCHANCGTVTNHYGAITRTVGTLDNPLGAGAPTEAVLSSPGLASPIDYVGAGPVFRVPPGKVGAGALLTVYHAERATYQAPYQYPAALVYQASFYSYLGLATSTDDGMTWTDQGPIVTANQPYASQMPGYEIGDGDLVVDQSRHWLYVYFADNIVGGTSDTFLSVARVNFDQLLNQAFNRGSVASFNKYYNGQWKQPGIAGKSSGILPQPYPYYAGAPQISWNATLGRYVAIMDDTQNISYAESTDGLTWTNTSLVLKANGAVENVNYAVPVGLNGDASTLGGSFYVFYLHVSNGGDGNPPGWSGADLRRLTVTCPGY